MEKITFRSVVMRNAIALLKATGETWRTCLLKAWEIYRLRKAMRQGVVHFIYRKADGGIREAHGTLMNIPVSASFKGTKAPNFATVCYYDKVKEAFRSFRVENLVVVL